MSFWLSRRSGSFPLATPTIFGLIISHKMDFFGFRLRTAKFNLQQNILWTCRMFELQTGTPLSAYNGEYLCTRMWWWKALPDRHVFWFGAKIECESLHNTTHVEGDLCKFWWRQKIFNLLYLLKCYNSCNERCFYTFASVLLLEKQMVISEACKCF